MAKKQSTRESLKDYMPSAVIGSVFGLIYMILSAILEGYWPSDNLFFKIIFSLNHVLTYISESLLVIRNMPPVLIYLSFYLLLIVTFGLLGVLVHYLYSKIKEAEISKKLKSLLIKIKGLKKDKVTAFFLSFFMAYLLFAPLFLERAKTVNVENVSFFYLFTILIFWLIMGSLLKLYVRICKEIFNFNKYKPINFHNFVVDSMLVPSIILGATTFILMISFFYMIHLYEIAGLSETFNYPALVMGLNKYSFWILTLTNTALILNTQIKWLKKKIPLSSAIIFSTISLSLFLFLIMFITGLADSIFFFF